MMYDELIENDPKMKKMRAESEARGFAKGLVKGSRHAIVIMTTGRFPALAELARKRTSRINNLEALHQMAEGIVDAPDETAARALLEASLDMHLAVAVWTL